MLNENIVKNNFPDEIFKLLRYGDMEKLKISTLKNIRPITYSVLNEENKMMYGLKIKNVVIHYENTIIRQDAIIALSKRKISNADALIGINLIEGGMNYGYTSYNKSKSQKIIC